MRIGMYNGGKKSSIVRSFIIEIHMRHIDRHINIEVKRITPLSDGLLYFRPSHSFDNTTRSGNLSPN